MVIFHSNTINNTDILFIFILVFTFLWRFPLDSFNQTLQSHRNRCVTNFILIIKTFDQSFGGYIVYISTLIDNYFMNVTKVVGQIGQIQLQTKDIQIAHVQQIHLIWSYLNPINCVGENPLIYDNFIPIFMLQQFDDGIALYFSELEVGLLWYFYHLLVAADWF